MAKAATPSSTFCEDLTITLYVSATSPKNLPEATTAPVVSIVPPIHAPATSCDRPSERASQGIRYIIGTATTSTSETTNDSFRESPLIAPQVAMAAETPQIDTALGQHDAHLLVQLSFCGASQNVKYQTEKTTTTLWAIPKKPAFMISPNSTEVPSSTSPILM